MLTQHFHPYNYEKEARYSTILFCDLLVTTMDTPTFVLVPFSSRLPWNDKEIFYTVTPPRCSYMGAGLE